MNPGPPAFRLLVGSEEFLTALEADTAAARERVWLQTLSFEGDTAGQRLAQLLRETKAPDKRILVDEFTRFVQNDRFLFSPRSMRDGELQKEVNETYRLLRELTEEGVGVRWGSPWGFLGRRAAWRDHKKLILVDGDICYLGGINFTEHNFSWHDMMIRIEHPDVAAYCARGYERSWVGERLSESRVFDGLELHTIDPPDLSPYGKIWALLAGAEEEIFVESAYITLPLTDALADAAKRGVRVRVLSPEGNNIPLFRRYITWEAERHGFDLNFMPGMTHMKAILIDGRTLIVGSANFHFTGHWTQNEIVAIVTNPELVKEFVHRVLHPDWAGSKPSTGTGGRDARMLRLAMKAYRHIVVASGRGRLPPPRPMS